jgi:hypothetical protein
MEKSNLSKKEREKEIKQAWAELYQAEFKLGKLNHIKLR